MMSPFCFMILALTLKTVLTSSAHWSYHGEHGYPGPVHWPKMEHSKCGSASQSPINIVTNDAITVPGTLIFEGYDIQKAGAGRPVSITNNGHTVQVALEGNYFMSGTGLPGKYKAVQFHFHWGRKDHRGSEHALNGKKYSAELHIVHYNTDKYASLSEAVSSEKVGAVGVVGVFLEARQQDNANLDPVIEGLSKIRCKGDVTKLKPFSLSSILPSDVKRFYRYEGSLTTPNCNQDVTWTIFEKPIPISRKQLHFFRKLYETVKDETPKEHLVDNFRPLQKLNGRKVYLYSTDVKLDLLRRLI
ncbi:Receptor-type tyrosine-protein phosphatase gamma [Holothuria leucospilota]|uniref:Carbonic anhydrase n=1 Tax=Holothuria leucospilota TaxID=206669 RepID=A0A9Q1CRV6_HOLLE|nr:Receptor-type tyrosine-protein phosphatase gamma [Holothuria leucospilota]